MRARKLLIASLFMGLGGAVFACVDLFHDTDFETLCTRDPSACTAEGSIDSSSGPDADGPPVDFCGLSSTEARAKAERACAWLGACEGPNETTVFGPCMMQALAAFDCKINPGLRPAQPVARLWSCIADANTCGAVDACIFPNGAPPPCGDGTGPFFACTSTESAIRVTCAPNEPRPTGVDLCALTGRVCTDVDGGGGAQCTGTRRQTCSGKASCDGTSAIVCDPRSVDKGLNCASFGGGQCVGGDGGVSCSPSADADQCSADSGALACKGGVAAACVDGRSIAIDCTRMGLGCDATKGTTLEPLAACRGEAGTCGADQCDGNKLTSCANGLTFEVDCAKQGLAACRDVKNSVALKQCGPPL